MLRASPDSPEVLWKPGNDVNPTTPAQTVPLRIPDSLCPPCGWFAAQSTEKQTSHQDAFTGTDRLGLFHAVEAYLSVGQCLLYVGNVVLNLREKKSVQHVKTSLTR